MGACSLPLCIYKRARQQLSTPFCTSWFGSIWTTKVLLGLEETLASAIVSWEKEGSNVAASSFCWISTAVRGGGGDGGDGDGEREIEVVYPADECVGELPVESPA